jgi:hypothetical protein
MRQRFMLGIAITVGSAILLFAADYAWLRVRIAGNDAAFDTVQIDVVEQIPQKGNKAEYVPEDPQLQSCVRSIFPHMDQQPCWYLKRHAHQQINF